MPGIIEDWRVTGAPAPKQTRDDGQNPRAFSHAPAYSRPLQEMVDDPLYGQTTPTLTLHHEKPWHRRAQELKMQGYSNAEISGMLGKSLSQLRIVLGQPWSVDRMNNRMKEDASAQIKAFLEEECLPSLVAIKEVRDSISESVRTSDRLNAAQYLTDRFLGKATQPISSVDAKPPVELTNDELNTQVQGIVAGMATASEDAKEP